MVVTPSLACRRDEWFKVVASVVDWLLARIDGFEIEDLIDSEVFVSAVIRTARIAISTHQEET